MSKPATRTTYTRLSAWDAIAIEKALEALIATGQVHADSANALLTKVRNATGLATFTRPAPKMTSMPRIVELMKAEQVMSGDRGH